MLNFTYQKTHDGEWEVIMQGGHIGGRKAHLPRRLCLCGHEDDAKCISEAMTEYQKEKPLPERHEYYGNSEISMGGESNAPALEPVGSVHKAPVKQDEVRNASSPPANKGEE